MTKNKKIITAIVAAFAIAMIPIITSSLSAATPVYGPFGAFSVYVNNNIEMADSTVEGRIAVGNDALLSGTSNKIASGYDAATVIGYFLDSTEYPSLVVKNYIDLLGDVEITGGSVVATDINDEQLLTLEGADQTFTRDTNENLTEGFNYFSKQAESLVTEIMARVADENDPSTSQTYSSFYDKDDKSLILIDANGEKISTADDRYEETSSEVSSEEPSSEQLAEEEANGTNYELNVGKIEIGSLQAHEKIIVRSNAQYVNFNQSKIYYEGQEIQIDLLDNEDPNVESLANNIVWVFPNAKEVILNEADVVGSILAPNANVSLEGSTLAGQLYANNLALTNQAYIVNRVNFINDYDFSRTIHSSSISIEFVDEEGTFIHETSVFTREIGTVFKTKLPVLNGYIVNDVDKVELIEETGVIVPEENTTITIQYAPLFTAMLTVNHQLADGTDIIEPEVLLYEIGEEYTTAPMADENYTVVSYPDNATGVMTSEAVEVTYVYADADNISTITVKHVDSTGQELINSTPIIFENGTTYDVSNQVITNRAYQYVGLYSGSAPITGTTVKDITVMLEYKPVSTCGQLGTTTSGANAETSYDITNKNQIRVDEVEYDEVKATGLVEQHGTTVTTEGYDFGTGYSSETTNPTFVDYKSSFNGNKNFDQFIPIRQTGDYQPINIILSNEGNSYDLRSRNNTATLADYNSNGVDYQKIIASAGNKSLNIQFDECQATVSFNNGTTSTNGTVIQTFEYTDFTYLDETLAGFAFDWDAANKKLTVNIVFDKAGVLVFSGNTFTIDLSGKSFLPQDFTVAYQNTEKTQTTVYRPYTSTDHYLYEVVALQSPYIDTTNQTYNLSTALGYNEVYEVYAVNGNVQSATKITNTNNITTRTLPYNPQGYKTMISSSFPRKDSNVYAYMVGKSKTISSGFTLKAENQAIYGKNKHPYYSASTETTSVAVYEGIYERLEEVKNISFNISLNEDGELVNTTDTIAETAAQTEVLENFRHVVVDQTGVDFNKEGNYSAIGYQKSRNSTTGEYINTKTDISIVVSGAVLDYGDAPESYGSAGAKVGNARNRYNIGVNRNGARATHADAEASPYYSSDARGDDTTGMTDETGWFNMDTNGIGELNIEMEKMRISFPYTASGQGAVAFWIDFNQNGVFEDFEGQVKNVNASNYDAYGMVNFDIDLSPSFSTLEAGDTTFARVRILSSKQNLSVADASTDFEGYFGETEDFQVNLYGKKNEYQICTQILANTPIVTVKNVSSIKNAGPNGDESGIRYVFDIGDANPNSNSSNSFYPDVQVTVTSKQGIVANTKAGDPAYFRVEQSTSPYERPANTIHIQSRNKAGEPINLPFTFSFWDLDDFTGSNIVESISMDKSSVYMEGLEASDIKLTADSVGMVEDYDTYIKLFTTEQVESEPEAMFLMQGTSLALSDISIVEEARLLEIGMGLDLGQMDKVIEECVEPYEPKAQIQIFDDFYDNEVEIYNSYPFAYQSTNVPIPYFANFNSVTQNLYIPHGVEFVDGNTDVTVYRRSFFGNRTENDWEVVDPSLYTQVLDVETNTSSVTFENPVENNIYGYEYRMEYNFEISEDMETGQRVVFKSDFVYNKGKTGETTEVYNLNDVTAIVKEAFTADINTIMSDEVVHVETDSSAIKYTYEYLNCDAEVCTNQTEPQPLSGDIVIPIPAKEDMQFASEEPFDAYEDILLTLYDNDMKVFEIPIRRWYPTELEISIEDTTDLTQISEDLNPIGQTVQVRAAYKLYDGFDKPVKTTYTQEVLNVQQESTINDAENSILRLDNIAAYISTEPLDKVPSSWQPSDWGPIEVDDLAPVFDSSLVYIPVDEQLCTGEDENGEDTDTECIPPGYHLINIEEGALDSTLETSKVTIDGKDYKSIYFRDIYSLDEEGKIILDSKLDNRYVIETFSGRIYNKKLNSECKLTTEANEHYTGMYCYGDEKNNYQLETGDIDQILAGYNDINDGDIRVNSVLTKAFPLSTEVKAGDSYEYFIYLADFGLNKTSITIADELVIKTTPIGYYGNESSYYFKRTNPTEEEVTCIKNDTCTDNYEVLVSGTIDNTQDVKNEITNNTSLLENYVSNMEWLEDYYKSYV